MDYLTTSMSNNHSDNHNAAAVTVVEKHAVELPANHSNLRRKSRSGLRNAETWARKRALMQRGYEWTTTFEGTEQNKNGPVYPNFDNTTSLSDSFPYTEQLAKSAKVDTSNRIVQDTLRRRRSSRRLPQIPPNHPPSSNHATELNRSDELIYNTSSSQHSSGEHPSHPVRDSSLSNRSNRSKSIDSDSSLKTRSSHSKLAHAHQSPNAKSMDVSNLDRRKSLLIISNNSLLPQRSLDYPCIVRKAQDLSDIVRRRMLYSKISKQQGDSFSMSLEREHVPKVPRKIIIRQDNSIEIALR